MEPFRYAFSLSGGWCRRGKHTMPSHGCKAVRRGRRRGVRVKFVLQIACEGGGYGWKAVGSCGASSVVCGAGVACSSVAASGRTGRWEAKADEKSPNHYLIRAYRVDLLSCYSAGSEAVAAAPSAGAAGASASGTACSVAGIAGATVLGRAISLSVVICSSTLSPPP